MAPAARQAVRRAVRRAVSARHRRATPPPGIVGLHRAPPGSLVMGQRQDKHLNTPDPVSGLTPRDIVLVRKSWKPISKKKVNNGIHILRQLFKADPETKRFFEMLNQVPITELEQSAPLKAHVIKLMTSLDNTVTHLHEPDVVTTMMHKIGTSHNQRNIRKKHFMVLQGVLVNVFKDDLKLDEQTMGAWGKTLEFLYRGIFEKLDE